NSFKLFQLAKKLPFFTHFLYSFPSVALLCNSKKPSTGQKIAKFRYNPKRLNEFSKKIAKNNTAFLALFIFLSVTATIYAQQMTPEQVVQKQLEAYNQRDIEKFMSVIDPEVVFYNFSDGKKTMEGASACRAFYTSLFEASPKLHSTILTRTVFGNKVLDHESISGRNGKEGLLELLLIYEVHNEKIIEVTVLRKEE
ncbi:MAG: nuclear transport factor 2 family protein, partial [Saonia sp.]